MSEEMNTAEVYEVDKLTLLNCAEIHLKKRAERLPDAGVRRQNVPQDRPHAADTLLLKNAVHQPALRERGARISRGRRYKRHGRAAARAV